MEPRFTFDLRKSGEAKHETQCEMDTDVNRLFYSKVYVMVFVFFIKIMARSYIREKHKDDHVLLFKKTIYFLFGVSLSLDLSILARYSR